MSNLNKFNITEVQMLALANKCELPYQFGSNWMAKFLSYSQELLSLAAQASAAAPSGELPPLPWQDEDHDGDFEAWIEPRCDIEVAQAFRDYARSALSAAGVTLKVE